jgi:hypothetical protein
MLGLLKRKFQGMLRGEMNKIKRHFMHPGCQKSASTIYLEQLRE